MPPIDPVGTLISVAGVALVVGLVWLVTRKEAPRTLGGEAGLRVQVAREFPGLRVARVVLDRSDRRALALAEDGQSASLAFAMGGRVVCWRAPLASLRLELGPEVGAPPDAPASSLRVRTGDFTRPELTLALVDPSQGRGLPGLVLHGNGR